ncbi:MAG: hypothetical protein ACHQ0J_01255 [Candidatus Dormibacterales bacterium]
MEKTAKLREPDLVLPPEATQRLAGIVEAPHDRTAAKVNIARAVEALKQRRARLRARKPTTAHS